MGLEITEEFESWDCVAEMSDGANGLVPLSPELVAEITKGDDDPQFATFVIESGWSRSNRFWGPELFDDVCEQVNNGEPIVGYLGHIKPEDDPFTFPEVQLQWLKSKVIKQGDRAKLAVKAYVLPNTKGKDYLKRGIVKSVSWRGKMLAVPFEKGVRVKKYAIESIDLSRPRKAGMSASLVGALTSEMEGGNTVKTEEIAALSENELRAHNPALVTAIETGAKKPLETQVGEMETTVKKTKPVIDLLPKLRKTLKLADDVDDVTVLTKAVDEITKAGRTVRDSIISSVLGDKFNDPMIKRVLASEMENAEFDITGDTDKDEKTVGEMVDTIVNRDEQLKQLVSEMDGAAPNLANTGNNSKSGEKRELKPGTSTSNLRVRSLA